MFGPFHATRALFQKDEIVYLISGRLLSLDSIKAIDPLDRTIEHWSTLVDWKRQKQSPYVVVDPMSSRVLLYLDLAGFTSLSKVAMSTQRQLLVIAVPGDSAPQPHHSSSFDSTSPQNSPWGIGFESRWSRRSTYTWRSFLELRNEILKLTTRAVGSRMVSETPKTVSQTVYLWARNLAHYAEVSNPIGFIHLLIPFTNQLERILRFNGKMAMVTHLKISLFALYSFISGNPLTSTVPLGQGIRLRNGLPKYWHPEIRAQIRGNHVLFIRIMASLLNMYKAFEAPHPDFDPASIVQPAPNLQGPLLEQYKLFCKYYLPSLLKKETGLKDLSFKYESGVGLWIPAAGANNSGPSSFSIVRDAQAWAARGDKNHILAWYNYHDDIHLSRMFQTSANESHFSELFHELEQENVMPFRFVEKSTKGYSDIPATATTILPSMANWFWATRDTFSKCQSPPPTLLPPTAQDPNCHGPHLGRLHAIEEPAGKVRIVAICDYWTQAALKPVHDHLFRILAKISTDATFNQTGSIESYYDQGLSPHWSFDLKAATDTIPLELYKIALVPLMKVGDEDEIATIRRVDLWADILTDRDWLLPDLSGTVRYNTGQPMGALSSWASMAIVHHSLVQFAAWKAFLDSETWYPFYRVLGDDVDISKFHQVAENYQMICSQFGIVIGLLKSLKSLLNCFEFANQRYFPGGNISPLSLKEELASSTWASRLEYAKRILVRFGTKSKDHASAVLRKASTFLQWTILESESRLYGRIARIPHLFRFCLSNPFAVKTADINIETVLRWVRPLIINQGSKPIKVSPKRREEVSWVLTQVLFKLLRDRVIDLIKDCPVPFTLYKNTKVVRKGHMAECLRNGLRVPYSYESSPSISAASFESDITLLLEGGLPAGHYLNSGRNSYFSVLYTLYCINLQNQKTLIKIKELLEEIRAFANQPGLTDRYNKYLLDKANVTNPLAKAFELWQVYLGIPNYIRPDPLVPPTYWMEHDRTDSPGLNVAGRGKTRYEYIQLEEKLRGPFLVTLLTISKELGYEIQALPYVIFHTREEEWISKFNSAVVSYLTMKALLQISKSVDRLLLNAKNRRLRSLSELNPGSLWELVNPEQLGGASASSDKEGVDNPST
nr:MAG: putative RNA-dependent RNA polymerase [Mitoviridae sp.]